MASKSQRDSQGSLVSIDPIVARHITNARAMAQPSHTRTESTPVRYHGAQMTGYTRGHGRNNSAPIRQKRSNSLRRAKNSTEMLRQRPTRKEKDASGEVADSKRGRNFTVTNVGTGGMLYLRPSAHQRPMSPAISPPPLTPWTAPPTTVVMPEDNETVLFSTIQTPVGRGPTTRTRSVSPKRLIERINKNKEIQMPLKRPNHGRSQSFSTVDESRRSISEFMPKTLKIIINRADQSRPKTAGSGKPVLQIPIPHYKLGNPRFSTNGTPILRNSSFTKTSSAPSTRHPSIVKIDGIPPSAPPSGPPPSSLKAFAKLQSFDPSTYVPTGTEAQASLKPDQPVDQRTSAATSIGAAPSIYDELSEVYNDPSVVRFAHNIREVTAATPARIIAQISSESFMDYELVSDFFLTFRSYMSTIDVLDLLLARLKWAIGRMTDDGRIIRIRTFAALRHWILNYFMDDFVSNRHVRERFCDEVNEMYDEVKHHYVGVQSDLKILQDLKRCWNGRCSLYWDGEEFNMDGDPDSDIYPGGVIGSRNPDYIDPREIKPLPLHTNLPPTQPFMYETVQMSPPASRNVQNHPQKPSFASSGIAESLQSDQSIQPRSCSVLLGSNRNLRENPRPSKGPVPVSVLSRRQNAPTELKVTTNLPPAHKSQHRRGGNSIDSTRDRASVEVPRSAIVLPELHEGSVIRGYVYAPVEPFVQLPNNLPMSPAGRFDLAVTSPLTARSQPEHSLGSSAPAVKNIFGSIRRALSGKQGSSEVALITVSTQSSSSQTLEGKKSPMPLSTSRSQDELRKKIAGVPSKTAIRIDLLCAAAIESYQAAQPVTQHSSGTEAIVDISSSGALFPPPPVHRKFGELKAKASRTSSDGSGESGSILIVNDTDSEIPIMSGAIQPRDREFSQQTRSSAEHYLPDENASFETQIAFQDDSRGHHSRQIHETLDGSVQDMDAQPSTPTHDRMISSTASSNTMHHRNSLSSSVPPNRILASPGATASVVTPPTEYHEESGPTGSQGPAQTLRRRPGGDLRKNQNVHEMEPVATHHASDSFRDTFSTGPDSFMIIENVAQAQQIMMAKASKISMINTHSSQHLRPSFEAAVAGFSHIPDDDDGGLEATLLKLEGKYEKSPELEGYSPDLTDTGYDSQAELYDKHDEMRSSSPITGRDYGQEEMPHSPIHTEPNEREMFELGILPAHFAQKHPVAGLQIQSLARSEASTDSVPVLKRDMDSPRLPGPVSSTSPVPVGLKSGHNKSDSRETNPLREPSLGSYLTADNSNTLSGRSLLVDGDDDRSDLSSEISVDIINYSEAMGSLHSPLLVAPGTAISGLEIPSHPLAHSSFVNLSLHPSLALESKSVTTDYPMTPEPILLKVEDKDSVDSRNNSLKKSENNVQRGGKISAGPAHLPFVLACDSQMLAQQLTLVEQSALMEIEWSDLVEMRWDNNAANISDWAEYVTKQNVKGVDLVITRFNLMVKWALSEIVLTQDAGERVRVISKFIHVAAHARRLHNYATMLQLTIALTSTDCSRMTKTWDLVPGPDRSLLKNMESLIQPIRNFHDLRMEMESADLSDGCVPFIGE